MSIVKYIYSRINWLNKSESLSTPLGKTNLNHMDSAIYNIAENLNVAYDELSTGKFNEADANKVIVGMPTWDSESGLLTFKFYDGTEFSVDFNIEKIPVSFSMDSAGVITMTTSDGTKWTADIGDAIPDYVFEDSDRIAFSKTKNADGSYTIKADIVKNSITGEFLQPNYLAEITAQADDAKNSADNASEYADNAAYDAKIAQSYAIGGANIRESEDTDNAKYYYEQAKSSVSSASASASTASTKASEAASSASTASSKASEASESASSASASASTATTKASEAASSASTAKANATTATSKATAASTSATAASTSASNAADSETQAKYYYEQAKSISESFAGALRPMGTVTFANLPALSNAVEGDMYNVSDQFTTTSLFKEGSGNVIPAGSNVYKTSDGYWDILAGSPVTGIKGNAETSYRRGNVNITPADLGITNATTSTAGLMPSSDKTKLDATNIAYGTCSTAAGTAAKTISISGNANWKLSAGSIIIVKFSATNTAQNPTFNVNSTGAKSIWYNTALITTSNLGYAGTANRPMNFVYDGTQYVFVGWSLDSNTTYSNASLGQGYGTCTTAESTTAKVVTLSNYTLATGGIVAVKFTYAVPASATMNINSKGAKAIYYKGAAITADVIKAGDTATFIYNGTYYHLLTVDRDNNTTYGTGTSSTSGITKLYTSTGTATDGTMTQKAISEALQKLEWSNGACTPSDVITSSDGYMSAIGNYMFITRVFVISSVHADSRIQLGSVSESCYPLKKTALNAIGSGGDVSIQKPCTCYIDTDGGIYCIPQFSDTGASITISGVWRIAS